MIRSNSKLAAGGLLAALALAGCKEQQGSEPAAYPQEEPCPPPVQQPPSPAAGTMQQASPPAQAGQQGQQGEASQHGQPGHGQGEAAQAQPADDQAAQKMDPELTVIGIDVDTKLAQLCKIPGTNVFFKLDSARLAPESRERLQQIATCVTSGAAKGKDLTVVGHSDPRGPDDYNKHLGMSRAESVARYLESMGVKKARVELESRGEEGSPREPMTWSLQRRVTVRLQ